MTLHLKTLLLFPVFGIKELLWALAPHIEDLVLLPTPVLRLLNVIDDNHLYNEDEYEGNVFFFFLYDFFI